MMIPTVTIAPTAGGGFTAASQAEMESASSTTVGSTPGRQHFHPSAAKAWAKFNSAGTIEASYNIASITDNGTGDWTVNIATDFSSGNYVGISMSGASNTVGNGSPNYPMACASLDAGTFRMKNGGTGSFSYQDPASPDAIFFVAFGDQT